MTNNKPLKGTIWSEGNHNLYVNHKPATLNAPQYGIMQLFTLMKNKIHTNGGIPIGIDHLPEQTLNDNPILKKVLKAAKVNPYDVGSITKIGTDGDRIYALESKITDPNIQSLQEQGQLTDFSLVGEFKSTDCPTGQADYVVDTYTDVTRVDLVEQGGCKVCEISSDSPDKLILTAKMATIQEDKTMTDQDLEQIEVPTVEETSNEDEDVESTEDVEQTEEDETQEDEDIEETDVVEAKYISKAEVLDLINDAIKGNTEIVEAKINTMQLEAKATDLVEKYLKEGKILPKQKEQALTIAKADTESFNKFMASMPKVIDFEQKSKTEKIEAKTSSDLDEDDLILQKYDKMKGE